MSFDTVMNYAIYR